MRKEYDLSDARPTPYSKRLKKQITIRIDEDALDYFRAQSEQTGIPYQTLINLYLVNCASQRQQLEITWA